MERQLGESFEDYKKRRMIDKKATKLWLRGEGRPPVHISRIPVEVAQSPDGSVKTMYKGNTFTRQGDLIKKAREWGEAERKKKGD